MPKRFTENAQKIILIAQEEAKRLNHDYVGTEHILLGLAAIDGTVSNKILTGLGVTFRKVRLEIEKMVGIGDTIMLLGEIPFTPRAKKVLEFSVEESQLLGTQHIGTEHILLGLIREEEGMACKILENLGLNLTHVRDSILNYIGDAEPGDLTEDLSADNPEETTRETSRSAQTKKKSKTPTLDEYTRDLTALAKNNALDPVIGRDEEIERLVQILARRTKNNPVLLGEPGVGKTAIVEGLAQKIARGEISDVLNGKRLLALDLASVVAGTKYRGEFEQRLKNIIDEIAAAKDAIIFIDELHTIIGAGAAEGSIDASNMLKPALARGEVQCIGATTFDEYRKYIETDTALERRFQPITVDPPDVEQTITILKGIRAKYEQHHKVKYADDALCAAAAIADRYITDRAMPDKAIDLFDEAGARARLKNAVLPPEIKEKQKEYNQAVEEKDQALANKEFEKAAAAKDTEDRLKNYIDHLKKKWQEEREQKQPEVTKEDIALVASKWTGIPVTRLTQSETDKILHMEEHLHERIIGQEEAVRAVSQAIRRNRTGLGNPNRPIGGFLFLGPTGVGKTELAKSLASFLFGDEDAMIRLDMSEYMEKFAVSRLIGAPPGYVGYEEGGQLTEAVRRRPYSVVVLDELEKAHPDIYNILLQVLDEGYLSDTLGHKVSFKNCVVIMTSNVGAREITNKGSNLGFAAKTTEEQQYQDMRQGVMDEVKKTFNPEFINRIDEIVVFHALTKENIAQILDLALEEVDDKLANKELELELTDSAKNYLIERGFDAKYGARPLLRTLQRELEDPLAENILTSRYAPGTVIRVDLNKDTQKLTFSNAASKPKNAVAI
ncbi:MAG: ATP-dependent Clp protease ATP-binding subunit [Elusimicrobiaceae bacterium]|uniref:ATP-dependent Clp protease ATP-binding subunit n=1 Tax=Candidatus Avelusimicrobium faecicola TaxID=3416205 RepID=UPI002A79EECE|nr:ATP-dependent Clp protease ATP-binding subunit [Spirochaetota bacterium]MDY2939692.1 ATP-dependent Clp protease ATP-binding subunit [Elusimicrobiaceae bacterium]